jgi:hypothetical protein
MLYERGGLEDPHEVLVEPHVHLQLGNPAGDWFRPIGGYSASLLVVIPLALRVYATSRRFRVPSRTQGAPTIARWPTRPD